MTKTLTRRIKRLEGAGGDLENRVSTLAERLGVAPERILAAVGQHRERLAKEIHADGQITWEGLCWLRDVGAFR